MLQMKCYDLAYYDKYYRDYFALAYFTRNADNAAYKKHFLISLPKQLGHHVINEGLVKEKMVIVNGKQVTEFSTWGEINPVVKKSISDLCATKKATKVVTATSFGISQSVCNKQMFPSYGCTSR